MKGCRSCRAWVAIEEYLDRDDPAAVNTKVQLGECRRYAPRPVSLEVQDMNTRPRVGCYWSIVASDDACGEWEPAFGE